MTCINDNSSLFPLPIKLSTTYNFHYTLDQFWYTAVLKPARAILRVVYEYFIQQWINSPVQVNIVGLVGEEDHQKQRLALSVLETAHHSVQTSRNGSARCLHLPVFPPL